MAILIFISFCKVALLVSLKVVVDLGVSLSLLFISHGLKLCHFIVINVDEVLIIFSTFGIRFNAATLALSVMVAAHGSIFKHSHVIVFFLRGLRLVGILIVVFTIHTVLSVSKIN